MRKGPCFLDRGLYCTHPRAVQLLDEIVICSGPGSVITSAAAAATAAAAAAAVIVERDPLIVVERDPLVGAVAVERDRIAIVLV